jgi:hypothetical protein
VARSTQFCLAGQDLSVRISYGNKAGEESGHVAEAGPGCLAPAVRTAAATIRVTTTRELMDIRLSPLLHDLVVSNNLIEFEHHVANLLRNNRDFRIRTRKTANRLE